MRDTPVQVSLPEKWGDQRSLSAWVSGPTRTLCRIALAGVGFSMLACMTGSHPGVHPTPIGCPAPSGAPAPRTSEASFLQNSEREVRLAGLPPLLQDTLPPDIREVRLWHVASWVGETSVLRVRVLNDSVAGELILFAGSVVDTPPDAEAKLPRACRLLGRAPGRLACAAAFRDAVTWTAVLDTLEEHRVWTLPRGDDLPRLHEVLDGDGIYVEVRQGSCYRVYGYYMPETETTPEYRDAAGLKAVLFDLQRRWSRGPANPP